jgi:ankyrin repeat protein
VDDLFSCPAERTTGVHGRAEARPGKELVMTAHRIHPPARAMRENPDIDQLKRQARELRDGYRAGSPDAVLEVTAHHRTAKPSTFALHDAQFVLARSYGFESWPKLKAAVDGVTTARLHDAVEKGDLESARALLVRRPEIVDLMLHGPSGFEIRALHIAVMKRDVEMTRLLLETGADTRSGIWPNRDSTGPDTMARERGYDEIVALIVKEEAGRGARDQNAVPDAYRQLERAMMTGGEEAVISVFEAHPDLAGFSRPDGLTMLHLAAGQGMLLIARWLIDHGADVNGKARRDVWQGEERTPLDFAAWECTEEASDRSKFEAMAALLLGRGAALTLHSGAGTIWRRIHSTRCRERHCFRPPYGAIALTCSVNCSKSGSTRTSACR